MTDSSDVNMFGKPVEPQPARQPEPEPPQPKSGSTKLIVIAAVLAAVVVFIITAFLAPGFLRTGDDDAAGPRTVAGQLATAMNTNDPTAMRNLRCDSAEPDVDEAISGVTSITRAEVDDVRKSTDSEAIVSMSGKVDGANSTLRNRLLLTGGNWCWSDYTVLPLGQLTTTESPSANLTDPTTAAQTFIDALNAKDSAAAADAACPTSSGPLSTAVEKIITDDPMLKVGTPAADGVPVEGTVDGVPVEGTIVIQGDCVASFSLS